jgi:hypothetical protein
MDFSFFHQFLRVSSEWLTRLLCHGMMGTPAGWTLAWHDEHGEVLKTHHKHITRFNATISSTFWTLAGRWLTLPHNVADVSHREKRT